MNREPCQSGIFRFRCAHVGSLPQHAAPSRWSRTDRSCADKLYLKEASRDASLREFRGDLLLPFFSPHWARIQPKKRNLIKIVLHHYCDDDHFIALKAQRAKLYRTINISPLRHAQMSPFCTLPARNPIRISPRASKKKENIHYEGGFHLSSFMLSTK